jgi:hypothetical protein
MAATWARAIMAGLLLIWQCGGAAEAWPMALMHMEGQRERGLLSEALE